MNQTPDEIKRRLNDPIHVHYHIGDIEPRLTPLALHDLEFLHEDSLALIQQQGRAIENMAEVNAGLSRKRDAMKNHIQQLQAVIAQRARCIENLTDKLNAMNDEVAKLQAERDAIMRDMTKNCASCKYAGCNNPGSDGCPYVEQCQNYVKWQWRGVQKEK